MKSKIYLLFFLIMLFSVNACKDVEVPDVPPVLEDPKNPDEDDNPPVSGTFPTSDVQVLIPEGMNVNLEGATLYSGIIGHPVQQSGASKASIPEGNAILSFLTDREDRLILMGFLGKGRTEISTQSTAEALLYMGAGLYVYGQKVKEKYLEESSSLEELVQFGKEVENKLKANPFALDQGLLEPELRTLIEKFSEPGEVIDIRARVINTEPDIKSGIQVYDKDVQNIIISNQFRRRAHAFVYKESFKDRDRKETVLIRQSEYSGALESKSDHGVDPILNIDGFFGSLRNVVRQGGMKFAVMETDPINIPLETTESQAIYKVRVVGPVWGKATFAMTRAEERKAIDLTWKTAFYDLVWPALSELLGGLSDVIDEDSDPLKQIFSKASFAVGQFESIDEFARYGDVKKFALEMLEAIIGSGADNIMQDNLKDLLVAAYKKRYGDSAPGLDDFAKNGAGRALKVADLGLKAINTAWLVIDVNRANMLEIFRVEANDIPFRIENRESPVSVNEQVGLKITKLGQLSSNQSFWVKWRTTGKYGVLRDKEGRAGQEIETNFTEMNYRAISNPSQIDNKAQDMVYAEVFIKEGDQLTSIGLDSVKVNVKPIKLQIKPDGVTLSPKNSGTNQIKLYVENATGGSLENTDEFEYRYEWSTRGDYGMFNGYSLTESTQANAVQYVALDEDVEKGEEEIFVRVFRLEKGTTEEKLFGEAKGKIKIENDEKLKILHIPLTVFTSYHTNSQYGGGTNFLHASFPRSEEYERISVRFYGYKKTTIPASEGRSFSWNTEVGAPERINLNRQLSADRYIDKVPDNLIAIYYLTNASSSGTRVPELAAALQTFGGQVEVKIRLK